MDWKNVLLVEHNGCVKEKRMKIIKNKEQKKFKDIVLGTEQKTEIMFKYNCKRKESKQYTHDHRVKKFNNIIKENNNKYDNNNNKLQKRIHENYLKKENKCSK